MNINIGLENGVAMMDHFAILRVALEPEGIEVGGYPLLVPIKECLGSFEVHWPVQHPDGIWQFVHVDIDGRVVYTDSVEPEYVK